MSELEPTPGLPANMSIREIRFPAQIRDALFAAGLKTVGQVRTISDEALLALPDFGTASVANLRETLGLASTVRGCRSDEISGSSGLAPGSARANVKAKAPDLAARFRCQAC